MKIEVELLKIDQDTDKARACAVALLLVLPRDEAELAMREWHAVQRVRDLDAAAGPPAELKAGFAAASDEVAALQEATVPPQDAGYSAAPMPSRAAIREFVEAVDAAKDELELLEPLPPIEMHRYEDGVREYVDPPGVAAAKAPQHPDYKVGGWVVTDLGELAKIAALLDDQLAGPCVLVEVDEGEQQPTKKMLGIDQVRPATTAEVTAGAAREAMVPPTPVQDGGEKKKRGRPKKAEPLVVDAETAAEPKRDEYFGGNGPVVVHTSVPLDKPARYAATSLKDLCKLAEHHAGRQRVFDLFGEHGVTRLGVIDALQEARLRAAVLELVP